MSDRLQARAEVIKLARVLSMEEAELAFLQPLPADQIASFREQATERLFDSDSGSLSRVAAASNLLPSALIATIAQRSFGPLLCARAAGGVGADKALDVARRLPADFLADVTIELDPRRVAAIIGDVERELVVPVARKLGERKEYVTMGRFLAFVPDHAIGAAISVLDDEALLRTAFVLEHKDRLDHALGLLPPERLPHVIHQTSELGLWPEALDLLSHLSDRRLGPIADVVAGGDQQLIISMVDAVTSAGLWDSLLPVVRSMSDDSRARLAGMPPFHDPAVLKSIIWAAADQGLWIDLVPLIEALPDDVRRQVVVIAADLSPERLSQIIRDAAAAAETLLPLLHLLDEFDEADRQPVVAAIDRADHALAEDLIAALTDPALVAPLVEALEDDLMEAIRRAAVRLDMEAIMDQVLADAGVTPAPE